MSNRFREKQPWSPERPAASAAALRLALAAAAPMSPSTMPGSEEAAADVVAKSGAGPRSDRSKGARRQQQRVRGYGQSVMLSVGPDRYSSE